MMSQTEGNILAAASVVAGLSFWTATIWLSVHGIRKLFRKTT